MLAGQEAVTYVIRTIDKKRQLTASGELISIRWADDLNKSVDYEDVNRLLRKFQADDKILKVLATPEHSADHAWELKVYAKFDQYHEWLRKTKTYQDFTGEKPTSKFVLGASKVDFSASSEENKGRYLTAGQVGELYSMPEVERERVFSEHLTPKHKSDAERLLQAASDNANPFKTFETNLPPVVMPPNYDAEQTRLLRQIADNNSQQADKKLTAPTYDKVKRQLIFCNTPIAIPANTDQEALCKLLFRSSKPTKKPLEIGELLRQNTTKSVPSGVLSRSNMNASSASYQRPTSSITLR